jgi:hypothetical protein
MTSWWPIGNREDPNPAAALVRCSDISHRKSKRALGARGGHPPLTVGANYGGKTPARGGCGRSLRWSSWWSSAEYTKTPPKTGGCYFLLAEKLPKNYSVLTRSVPIIVRLYIDFNLMLLVEKNLNVPMISVDISHLCCQDKVFKCTVSKSRITEREIIERWITKRRIIEHWKLPNVESANAELLNIKSYRTSNRWKSN